MRGRFLFRGGLFAGGPAERSRGAAWISGVALIWIAALGALALFAPWLPGTDPARMNAGAVLLPPSSSYILGTDALGRDLWSRLLWGSRVSLGVGAGAAAVSLGIGLFLGSAAGFMGGRADRLLNSLSDLALCFPVYFALLAAVAIVDRPGLTPMVVILGFSGWMTAFRLFRAEVLSLREREFVLAARLSGLPDWKIWTRHLLPHLSGVTGVSFTTAFANAVLAESALSFLGLGVQPPTPSWGNLLLDGKNVLGVGWWLWCFPGLFVAVTVWAVYTMTESFGKKAA